MSDLYFPGHDGRSMRVEEALDRIERGGLRSEQDYGNLRRGLEEGLAGLPLDEAESALWRNNVYRLAIMGNDLRDRRQLDDAKREAFRLAGPLGEGYLVGQRQTHVMGEAPLDWLPRLRKDEFMPQRNELQQDQEAVPRTVHGGRLHRLGVEQP